MTTLPVTLGGLELLGTEVPSFFDRGGRMRVAVHHVIGGDRVVQVLGAEPQRRELTGCFIGSQAAGRGQLLEAMRDTGLPLLLTIGAWTEYVLITSVVVRYAEKGTVVHYLVEAEALPISVTAIIATEATIVTGLLADLSQSTQILSGVSGSPGTFTASQAALSAATAAVSSSYQSGGPIGADVLTPGLSLMSVIDGAGSDLSSVSANAEGRANLVAGSADLSRATEDALSLATATQAGAYLNRASASLSGLGGTASLPIVHS